MVESQLKALRELANIFDADTKISNRDTLTFPPVPLIKKSYKFTRVEDQMDLPPKVDPNEESRYRYQKLPSAIETTPPSAASRDKYTKILND